jgi:UDP-3-O-[3-hydroxymyristoyl] glucosamine N-acyltransferase
MRAEEIARLVGGKLQGDGTITIRGVASLESAGPDDLSFAETPRALGRARESRAGCILVPKTASILGRTTVAVEWPKWALVRVAEALYPPEKPAPGIHPTAVVDASAEVAPGASIGPHAVVEKGARVGARTRLGAGVFIGAGAQVGADCVLYPRVTIYSGADIGDRVILHAGVVIGSDGFGYVFAGGQAHKKFPQIGQVVIEDDVEIGSNSTVDRGSLGVTRVGAGTKIDNLVQIAHNVKIGRRCLIAAQTGLAGSAETGDEVVMAGQVGVGDHARVEQGAVIGGQAGVLPGKIVRKGATVWGTPARPLSEHKKMQAQLSRLARAASQPAGGKAAKRERRRENSP